MNFSVQKAFAVLYAVLMSASPAPLSPADFENLCRRAECPAEPEKTAAHRPLRAAQA